MTDKEKHLRISLERCFRLTVNGLRQKWPSKHWRNLFSSFTLHMWFLPNRSGRKFFFTNYCWIQQEVTKLSEKVFLGAHKVYMKGWCQIKNASDLAAILSAFLLIQMLTLLNELNSLKWGAGLQSHQRKMNKK